MIRFVSGMWLVWWWLWLIRVSLFMSVLKDCVVMLLIYRLMWIFCLRLFLIVR